MKNLVLGTAVAIAWCAAVPAAQQQPSPTPQKPPAHNVFVLSGCLEAGETPSTFKLTGARSIGQAPPAAAEAAAVGTSGQKTSYVLMPVSGLNAQGMREEALKPHVGQQVEAILRPIESPAPAPATGVAETPAAKPAEPAPERFSVTEIRRVIGVCSKE